jgi:hypothetical protein
MTINRDKSYSFLKKEPKNLYLFYDFCAPQRRGHKIEKSFCFFFFRKRKEYALSKVFVIRKVYNFL